VFIPCGSMAMPGIWASRAIAQLGWHATCEAHKPNAGRRARPGPCAPNETITIAGGGAASRGRGRKCTDDKWMFESGLPRCERTIQCKEGLVGFQRPSPRRRRKKNETQGKVPAMAIRRRTSRSHRQERSAQSRRAPGRGRDGSTSELPTAAHVDFPDTPPNTRQKTRIKPVSNDGIIGIGCRLHAGRC
jgi:hypothetical protein